MPRQGLRGVLTRVVIIGTLLVAISSVVRAADAPRFNTAVIRGSSVYAAPALFQTYRGLLGRPLTPEVATKVASALGSLYEHDCYSRT